jgi:GTPase SAR1 family protein
VFTYRVAMIGAQGVGKTALVSQFMTSECINAYDRQRGKWFQVFRFRN